MFSFQIKLFLVLRCLLYCAETVCGQNQLSSQELGSFSSNERECIDILKVNETMISIALKQLYMPENITQFNNFMECTWRKDGLIEEDGTISINNFKYYVRGAFMDAVNIPELAEFFANDSVENCKNVQGSTSGQKGVRLMNCVLGRLYAPK